MLLYIFLYSIYPYLPPPSLFSCHRVLAVLPRLTQTPELNWASHVNVLR